MIISINQPAYLPWLGYFERIARSDIHVVLDHVQFEKNSFVNRNRILAAGGPTWLTVPVKTKGKFGDLPICKLEIDNQTPWRRKHWQTLQQAYGQAPHFDAHAGFFSGLYEKEWTHLSDLCGCVTRYLLEAFAIDTKLVQSSTLDVEGRRNEMLIELCRSLGATEYISGAMGRDYIDPKLFEDAGITLSFQDYDHPQYTQLRAQQFESNLSAVDFLFNHGPDSRDILLNQSRVSQVHP
ncbi:MAG: hypothetical protein DHS20C16_25820 [Phycisphaerae bacterium]|nr:MAG: hypothetical protein DHS20C16_25820 [Phycisphaerae bacterium]